MVSHNMKPNYYHAKIIKIFQNRICLECTSSYYPTAYCGFHQFLLNLTTILRIKYGLHVTKNLFAYIKSKPPDIKNLIKDVLLK